MKPKVKKHLTVEEWVELGNLFKLFKATRIAVLEKCRKLPKSMYAGPDWWMEKRMATFCDLLDARFSREYPEMYDNKKGCPEYPEMADIKKDYHYFYGNGETNARWKKVQADFLAGNYPPKKEKQEVVQDA